MLTNIVQLMARAAEPLLPEEWSGDELVLMRRVRRVGEIFNEYEADLYDNSIMPILNSNGDLTRAVLTAKLAYSHWWETCNRSEQFKLLLQMSYGTQRKTRTRRRLRDTSTTPMTSQTLIDELRFSASKGYNRADNLRSLHDTAEKNYMSWLRTEEYRSAEVNDLLGDIKGLQAKLKFMMQQRKASTETIAPAADLEKTIELHAQLRKAS